VSPRRRTASPDLAPVYFHRARARASFFQFSEASTDQLWGLIHAARAAAK
jgi:hypothetical protein